MMTCLHRMGGPTSVLLLLCARQTIRVFSLELVTPLTTTLQCCGCKVTWESIKIHRTQRSQVMGLQVHTPLGSPKASHKGLRGIMPVHNQDCPKFWNTAASLGRSISKRTPTPFGWMTLT